MRPLLLLVVLFLPLSASADGTAGTLESAADELDAIVADLEETQARTARLQDRLDLLESLSTAHQTTLADQEAELSQYRATVAELENHDRKTLALAEDLGRQLAFERHLNQWLIPTAGLAVAVCVVEGWLLLTR